MCKLPKITTEGTETHRIAFYLSDVDEPQMY